MRLIFIPLFALWLGGCADENRPVATIAGEAIAGETIRAIVAKLPVGLRNKEGGDAARQQYLQSIIDRRLLLTEAAAHGMDTLRAVTRKVRETVDGRVIVLYRSRFLAPEAAVPEGEYAGSSKKRATTASASSMPSWSAPAPRSTRSSPCSRPAAPSPRLHANTGSTSARRKKAASWALSAARPHPVYTCQPRFSTHCPRARFPHH